MPQKLPFLKVNNTRIVDDSGKAVILKGISLGGWLMMEGYMLYSRNIPERDFKASFERALGREALEDFTRSFRDIFIREEDFKIISKWGANCVRIPFNYRIIEFEDRPLSLNDEGLSYLDKAIRWCEKYGLYCILDMHAAPGAQNTDWHADCSGNPDFFGNDTNKERFVRLWRFLAERYKDVGCIAGYDLLNEPLLAFEHEFVLRDLYEKAIKEIRDAGDRHIVFLEGNFWAQRINFLKQVRDQNVAYSIHTYPPPEYVFNWETDLVYPGKVKAIMWNKNTLEFLAKRYYSFGKSCKVPLYVGEFGINWRGGEYGELKWVRDILDIFKKYGAHWTYWTYKTVANSIFPDGVFRYTKNPHWVNRKGPVVGWETFAGLWPKEKMRMIYSWRTENFQRNDKLYLLLKRYF